MPDPGMGQPVDFSRKAGDDGEAAHQDEQRNDDQILRGQRLHRRGAEQRKHRGIRVKDQRPEDAHRRHRRRDGHAEQNDSQ